MKINPVKKIEHAFKDENNNYICIVNPDSNKPQAQFEVHQGPLDNLRQCEAFRERQLPGRPQKYALTDENNTSICVPATGTPHMTSAGTQAGLMALNSEECCALADKLGAKLSKTAGLNL